MLRIVIFTILVCFTDVFSQYKLVLENNQKKKKIEIKQDDNVKFEFKGYLNQTHFKMGYVASITSDTIYIYDSEEKSEFENIFSSEENTYKVFIKDIVGFRKFSKYRDWTYLGVFGVVLAADLLLFNFLANQKVNNNTAVLVSLGAGALSGVIIQSAFSTKIKNYTEDGWKISVERDEK